MHIVKGLTVSSYQEIELLGGMKIKVPVFKDAGGEDWSDICKRFNDTSWKILVDSVGRVRGYTKQADSFSLYEDDINTVVELSDRDIPDGFFDPSKRGSWCWTEDCGVVARVLSTEESFALNVAKKKELLENLLLLIAPLQASEKYGMQTPKEKERLMELELLLVDVGRIDPLQENISWPHLE